MNLNDDMHNAYRQRSNFVHDGVFTGIDDETILFLRKCVRKALITIDSSNFDKLMFIGYSGPKEPSFRKQLSHDSG